MKCALSYGANAYTLHINQNIPLEEAKKIEDGFKELHEGVYEWGAEVFREAVRVGYIESADGWKLKLPEFEKFCALNQKIQNITREQWQRYKQGKIEWKAFKEDRKYKVKIQQNFDFYRERRKEVSDFFKLKSEYQRLALNNPVQTRGSHMSKRAMYLFFDWLLDNNLINRVKICNLPHDEFVIECEESLGELIRKNVEKYMIEGGNYYLNKLTIKADAHLGASWGEAKS